MRAAGVLLLLSLGAAAEPDPKVELGRRLFFDRTVSRTGRVSCSSCHDPEHGFSDRRVYSEDEAGDTVRHSMSILDTADGRPLHWDGEFADVRELLTARLGTIGDGFDLFRAIRKREFDAAKAAGRDPNERDFESDMASGCFYLSTGPDRALSYKPGQRPWPVPMLLRLAEDSRYLPAFEKAFGSTQVTTERIIDALLAYVLSLRSGESAFDRHLAGDTKALTEAQRRGLALFKGKAGCAACHPADAAAQGRPNFTDGGFHNTGVAFVPVDHDEDEEPTLRGILLECTKSGRGEVTHVREDLGRFKTPSLRDVARRGPYMHDGSLATLEDVVRYYDRGGVPNPGLDQRMHPLGLTDKEVSDLVAFLRALRSDERPGIGPLPASRTRLDVRVVDLLGKPIPGLRVEFHPAGDRLQGGRTDDPPQSWITGKKGRIVADFPRWTHVRLVSETHEIHYDWLIPDCAPPMEVMAAPRDTVALKLTMRDTFPRAIDAGWVGGTGVTSFRLVRKIGPITAIYVAPRREAETPWVCARLRGTPRELDLSGGWTDPIDDRPDPDRQRRHPNGTGP